jgi:vancomycin resistance protein YoaR
MRPIFFWIISIFVFFVFIIWFGYPFHETLASSQIGLIGLSQKQINNIQIASQKINGLVLKPGEKFSFNRAVGPRTEMRGYKAAPSYLGKDSPSTIGGGICLLSSALYQAALKSDLQIIERFPHLRTIKSVPLGLDATVWYGVSDLSFQNNLPFPLQIKSEINASSLLIQIKGKSKISKIKLEREVHQIKDGEIQVIVYKSYVNRTKKKTSKDLEEKRILISSDLYRR